MDRKTALSAAGAFVLTAVAAVSALFVTMGAGAESSNEPTDPVIAQPEVVTEYEVVQLEPEATDTPVAGEPEVVYDIQYVQEDPAATGTEYEPDEYEDDDHEEEEEGEEYEDDEGEADHEEEDDD